MYVERTADTISTLFCGYIPPVVVCNSPIANVHCTLTFPSWGCTDIICSKLNHPQRKKTTITATMTTSIGLTLTMVCVGDVGRRLMYELSAYVYICFTVI